MINNNSEMLTGMGQRLRNLYDAYLISQNPNQRKTRWSSDTYYDNLATPLLNQEYQPRVSATQVVPNWYNAPHYPISRDEVQESLNDAIRSDSFDRLYNAMFGL